MGALDNRHALITGGGTGIGAAIARALAKEGAAVSLAGRRKAPLDDVAAKLPKATAIVADVTKESDCAAMAETARAANGPIDIVIANAGAAAGAPVAKLDLAHWHNMIDVNLTGAFLTVKAALADVTRKSEGPRRIIFIASTAGLKGYPYVAAYCAAKHGVVGLARALSLELEPTGVTVNAVCPGYTDTPLLDTAAGKNFRQERPFFGGGSRYAGERQPVRAAHQARGGGAGGDQAVLAIGGVGERTGDRSDWRPTMSVANKPRERTAAARPPSKQRLRLWLRLLRSSRAIEARLRERLRTKFAITLPQFDVMATLARYENGITMTELSRHLMVSNGNVTGIIDRLAAEKLVLRQAPATDRRSYIVRLTPKGVVQFSAIAKGP
jgi:NAD(P)-dependent dehydrogenase (short-subunit alcohol dehydrogenase family)/DNA-binding MarR family transcriptional regulator